MSDYFGNSQNCFCETSAATWAGIVQAASEARVAAQLASTSARGNTTAVAKKRLDKADFDLEVAEKNAEFMENARATRCSMHTKAEEEEWIACDNADTDSKSKNRCFGFLWYHVNCLPAGTVPSSEVRSTEAWVCAWCKDIDAGGPTAATRIAP
mmetsp:Transcript_34438/g.63017  ORF Transcript_34438/g.63017 Transcript_34438/m.63017 type:complete len:154 (+) Transcript_34438:1419-1880(+)